MTSIIPTAFRATISDRFIAAFFKGKGDVMIQVELKFSPKQLREDVLRRAFELALDAEPVLGCRLSCEKNGVRWIRLDNNSTNNFILCRSHEEYISFFNETIDAQKGPALKGGFFHADDGDRLIFKIAHEVADATGAKDIVELVAMLYRQLLRSPEFVPAPNTKSYRSARQIFRWFPKRTIPFIWLNALIEILPLLIWKKSSNPFSGESKNETREYVRRTISKETVAGIKKYASRHNATLNDVMLTAFFRALHSHSVVHKGYLRCGITVDLRKWYLSGGKADTVSNLSTIEIIHHGKKTRRTFEETLTRVVAHTARRKRRWIGLNFHLGLFNLFRTWSFEKMDAIFSRQKEKDIRNLSVFPVFTNLGILERKHFTFEEAPVEAHIYVPAAFPPYFAMGVSSYNGALTFTVAAYSETREKVTSFLNDMMTELEEIKEK